MKHTFSTKFIATLLAVVMLATFVPVFFSFAAEEAPDFKTLITTENEDGTIDALSAENGNLAKNATFSFQYAPHGDANWGWDAALINDGTLNRLNNNTTNGGYHTNTTLDIGGGGAIFRHNRSEWIQMAFDAPKTFDTFVVWPCRDEDGQCWGMPNAFAVEVSGDGIDWFRVYEEYDYDIPAFGPQILQFKEITAPYVRFVSLSANKSTQGTYGVKFCEMAVFNTDYTPSYEAYCPNLAANKPVSSVNVHVDNSWRVEKINDGDRYNMYSADFQNFGQFAGWHSAVGAGTSEIVINLEEVQDVNRLVIWPGTTKYTPGGQKGGAVYDYGLCLPSSLTISVSTDGVDYTPVYTAESVTLDEYAPITYDFTKTSAQYVKVDMVRPDSVKLSEIEIYNTDLLVTPENNDDLIISTPNVNLAPNATVISSTAIVSGGWHPNRLNNGAIDTDGGFTSNAHQEQWVGYEFDNLTTVNTLVLYSALHAGEADIGVWSGIPRSFTVQYTPDNINWYDVITHTNETVPNGQDPVTVSFDPVVAKKIRINTADMYQKASDWNKTYIQLAEMEVWNIVEETPENEALDFTAGTIAETEAGKYTIASDNFSAFVSTKLSETAAHNDVRIILAADLETLAANLDAELTVTFLDEKGNTVKTFTEGVVEDLLVYASATAAGNTYTAADGDVLFGIVITGVPNTAWASVEVTLTSSEATYAGTVDAEDVITPDPIPDPIDIKSATGSYALEVHGALKYNPAFVFYIYGADAVWLDITKDSVNVGEVYSMNPAYDFFLNVNGTDVEIDAISVYEGGTWGYLRLMIGDYETFTYDENNKITFNIGTFKVVDKNGNTIYFANFENLSYEYEKPATVQLPTEAVCIQDIEGMNAHVWGTPFEFPGEFGGQAGLIYNIDGNDPFGQDFSDSIARLITRGKIYTVVTLNGTEYAIEQYVNSGNIFRMNVEALGAVIYSGLEYTIKVEFFAEDGTLLYYTKESTVTSTATSSNANERTPMNVTLPEGLSKLSVSEYSSENINHWGDGPMSNLFDGNTTGTKMGGNPNGSPTIYFTLSEAASITYYTFTTGGDTGTYKDRNPVGWTFYGKVDGEWVVLSTVRDSETNVTGFTPADSTPYSYQLVDAPACTEYKIVLVTGGGFQLNELELYKG